MDSLVLSANRKGLSVHTHTMGDAAVRRSVEAYARAYAEGYRDKRNTIVHTRNVAQEDYAIIKENDIAVTCNMNWHCFTAAQASHFKDILPKTYATEAYPMNSFFEHDIPVSQCTDTPADNGVNYPFHCMEVAVSGAYEASTYSWQPEELISRYQFLQAMTYNGAW